jgi:tetratricopeptide (TPR) repeat protein
LSDQELDRPNADGSSPEEATDQAAPDATAPGQTGDDTEGEVVEATHKGPPPAALSDVHDLTTAAPDNPPPSEVTEPVARGGEEREGAVAGGTDAGADEVEGKGIRVPPPHDPPREVQRWRMRALSNTPLILLDDEQAPESLTAEQGVLGEAELLLARGNLEQATEAVSPLLPNGDNDVDATSGAALGILIRGALMGGDVDKAKELIEPHRDSEHLAVADAAFSLALGQLERARLRIDVAMKLRPKGIAEVYTLALVRVAEGDMDVARELLTDVARSAPEHAVARHQLGQLVLATGDPARAGTLFEMAIELAPLFVPPALSLAEMLADSRQYGEAMQLLSDLCDTHPGLLAPRLVQLRILLSIGDLDTAGTLADALRQAAPNVPDVELLWAESAFRRGKSADAREALLALLPSGGAMAEKALRLLAQIELSSSPPDYAAAVGHLDQALAATPNSAELLLDAAQVHLAAGDMTSARERFEKLGGLSHVDLGVLLSASVAAQNHGLFRTAVDLAESALEQVRGTPAEMQISSFIAQLQGA